MIVKATAAVAAAAATLAIAPTAEAMVLPTGPLAGGGAFVIQSCGESGSTQGWTATNNAPARVETFTDCPPALGRIPEFPDQRIYTGLHAGGKRGRDSPTLDDAQAGDKAELTFTTAPGTQITRVRMWRAAGKDEDNDWLAYTKAGASTIDGCEFAWPEDGCMSGAPGQWSPNGDENDLGIVSYYDSALPGNLPTLATSTFAVGIACRNQGNNICANGYLSPDASAEIYSVFFTLSDPSAPTLGSAGGNFSSPQVLTSRPAFTIAGTDNSGIRAARLYLDGALVDEQLSSCSYDRPRPCADLATSQPLGFDPSTVADGDHQLQLAVVDAAGNETRTAPVTRSIDGTPPPAPQLTTIDQGNNNALVSWLPPSTGSGPIVATEARWQYCQLNGPCTEPVSAPPTSSTTQASSSFFQTVRVRLVDQLGRLGPEAVATLPYERPAGPGTTTPTTTPPTTTSTATTPTPAAKKTTTIKLVKASGPGKRVVALNGTVTVKSAKLSVTLTRKGHKRIVRTIRAKSGKFTLRIGHVPRGRWKISLRYAGSKTTKPAAATRTISVR